MSAFVKMKLLLVYIIVLLALNTVVNGTDIPKESGIVKSVKRSASKIIQLFHENDLSNWVFKLKNDSVDPLDVFQIHNGLVRISGNPYGYMRTAESYSDYALHVEWRWPLKPGNSGVFVHTQLPDTVPMKLIEVQLAAGHAGDFMCGKGVFMNELAGIPGRTIRKHAPSSEKPAGEWNSMDVICKKNTIEVHVNGVFQNKGTGLSLRGGHICLQSEGEVIEFRNVYLRK